MINIHIRPSEIWGYFQKNIKRLNDNLDCVAEVIMPKMNIPFIKVYLTNEKGYPAITIENIQNGEEIVFFEDCAISENDCINVYKNILTYLQYFDSGLDSGVFENTTTKPKTADNTDIDIVNSRESKLLKIVDKFITELMGLNDGESTDSTNEELTEILDAIEVLLFELGFVIYRPRIVNINGAPCIIESQYYEERDLY